MRGGEASLDQIELFSSSFEPYTFEQKDGQLVSLWGKG